MKEFENDFPEGKRFICLDTETTGLNCWRDEILQLSIVDHKGNELFNKYFKPKDAKEWPDAMAFSILYMEDTFGMIPILDGILSEDVIEKIEERADLIDKLEIY